MLVQFPMKKIVAESFMCLEPWGWGSLKEEVDAEDEESLSNGTPASRHIRCRG